MRRNFPGAIALLDDGPVGIIVSRMSDGVVLETNAACLRLIGYTAHEVVGHTAVELGLWDDITARSELLARVKKFGYAFDFPFTFRGKSGKVLSVRCSAMVIEVADEVCILSILKIPSTVATSLATHRDEISQLDSIEVAAGIGFWDFDALSKQVRWSYGMEAIYGLSKGDFKGIEDDLFARIHPDDVTTTLEKRRAAFLQKNPFDIKFRVLRSDGTVRWVVSRGSPRFDASGHFIGASGLQIDVTNQTSIDDEMRLNALVMENMAEGVLTVDKETGKILSANSRFEQMLGYAVGALKGQPIHTINAPSERDPIEVADAIMGELRSHGVWRGELKNLCANGREIWCSCTVSELTLTDKKKVWIGVHTDITERRDAQDERDKLLSELQRMSFNYQDSLEAERAAVAQRLHEELGRYLIGLKTKVVALSLALKTCDPELVDAAEQLLRETQKTQIVANEIATRLRPSILDDMGLAEACRWYINDWSEKNGIPVTSRIGSLKIKPCPHVATDIFRALQELLKNVIKHSKATKVHVSLSEGKTEIKLRVQDNGSGFDAGQKTLGFGLLGVRERVNHRRGAMGIETSPLGTQVTITMCQLETS
jgi:PAS domain S-box-containing protein